MNEIEKIADNYVNSFGEILPGFKYGFANLREFTSKYYFDFVFVQMNEVTPKEPPVAGGSCGFTIDKKTFEIENLTFGELSMLAIKERELNEVYGKIKNVKDNNSFLHWLKSKYELNSKQLLEIKKTINSTEFEKETVLEQINQIIKTTANNV
ncbi:MAG: hypothetical protein CMC05_11755 [Flavobacteriaceae bacterium]|jgi:hypothetical protein|nr:hypothetical protein [Flavobacteriaceae bacterium]|tara:strand:+ start:146 stop:604 length:459 start_codon:yes stop_codon:yes gene_type:complete